LTRKTYVDFCLIEQDKGCVSCHESGKFERMT